MIAKNGNKSLRLRTDLIKQAKHETTPYRIAGDAGIARTTAYSILGNNAQNISLLNLDNFLSILTNGLGLSIDEVLSRPLGDFFTIKGE